MIVTRRFLPSYSAPSPPRTEISVDTPWQEMKFKLLNTDVLMSACVLGCVCVCVQVCFRGMYI